MKVKKIFIFMLLFLMLFTLVSCDEKIEYYEQQRIYTKYLKSIPEYAKKEEEIDEYTRDYRAEKLFSKYEDLQIFADTYFSDELDLNDYVVPNDMEKYAVLLIFHQIHGGNSIWRYYDFSYKDGICIIKAHDIFSGTSDLSGFATSPQYFLYIVFIPREDIPNDFDYTKDYKWEYQMTLITDLDVCRENSKYGSQMK